MRKRDKIIYWIATIWLSLGMLSTGIVQLMNMQDENAFILQLGYPVYLLTLLGVVKIAGVVVILLPKLPLLKEWTYAGFVFVMGGAVFSHLASGHATTDMFGALLLLVLTIVSWYFRPAEKKIVSMTSK